MHTNRLIHEKSPYLLQHAHNPVDWYAWGPEAFERAKLEEKPIFLSVGYSTCHWCHVMERESFENPEIAALLNRSFVPVKVDREERPEVDQVYMLFVQATTGGGGWPMSVWLTPDLKPFFGGTYFPPGSRYGRPGFADLLHYITQAWAGDRQQILDASETVLAQLRRHAQVGDESASWAGPSLLDAGFQAFRRMFDTRLGGFGAAPKFPRPVVHNFLLRYFHRTANPEALQMVCTTLREMAKGGMHDQLGGGFHRYSVDDRWRVPHFEKMLYDQAQLAISYLEAYQITRQPEFAKAARDIFAYVLRDLTSPEGGFYSAEDADSVIDPARPEEKGEGAFYVWTTAGIARLLEPRAAAWFGYRYGIEDEGNAQNDPHGEFSGKNIPFEAHTVEETAARFEVQTELAQAVLEEARQKLFQARAARGRPHRDDKILAAWNGLMISAFAKGAQVLGEEAYGRAARRAADFILAKMYIPETQTLRRRYRDGEAAIAGFLEDYAFLAQALLDLYETEFDARLIEVAIELSERQCELFEDRESGAFFRAAAGDDGLVLRMKDDYDGAEPSGNSVAALNLQRLAQITGRGEFRTAAERTLAAFGRRMNEAGAAIPQMLVALSYAISEPKEIVLAGRKGSEDLGAMLGALRSRFMPNAVVLLAEAAPGLPGVLDMKEIGGKATAYVCRNYACQLPTNDVARLEDLLSGNGPERASALQ